MDEVEKIIIPRWECEEDILVIRLSNHEPIVYMSLETLSENGNDSFAKYLRKAIAEWEKNVMPTVLPDDE